MKINQECRDLTVLNLHHNRLSGFLPESLRQCTKLKLVLLTKNKFKGDVPPGISKGEALPSTPRTGTGIVSIY